MNKNSREALGEPVRGRLPGETNRGLRT